jgi:hypothetical protein
VSAPEIRAAAAGPGAALPAPDERRTRLALAALVVAYAAIHFGTCVVKYRAFLYDDIDLAIFTQALANLMRGSLGCSIRGMSWLGDHSSLNLFLVAPFYAIARTPLTLLFVQTVALALGALPVYRLARRELGDPWTALLCAALYLLHPALGYVNLFEFHPEALSTPALIAAIAYLREDRTRPMAFWATVALLGKEDVALAVAALGVYALALRRPGGLARGGALLGLAVFSLVVSFAWLKPALGSGAADYGAMYSRWGDSPRCSRRREIRTTRSSSGSTGCSSCFRPGSFRSRRPSCCCRHCRSCSSTCCRGDLSSTASCTSTRRS